MAAIFADIQPSRDKERAQAVPDSDNDEVRPDSAPGMVSGFSHDGRAGAAEISQRPWVSGIHGRTRARGR